MKKKRAPSGGPPPSEPAKPEGLSEALHALREATRSLAEAGSSVPDSQSAQLPPAGAAPSDPPAAAPADPAHAGAAAQVDADDQVYFDRLKQTGKLVDIAEDTDLSALSPRVTHVRRPDGTVERVGYSGS